VSEAAGFAGWLYADMHDIGTARSYYRLAIDRARIAKQDLLAGCARNCAWYRAVTRAGLTGFAAE